MLRKTKQERMEGGRVAALMWWSEKAHLNDTDAKSRKKGCCKQDSPGSLFLDMQMKWAPIP